MTSRTIVLSISMLGHNLVPCLQKQNVDFCVSRSELKIFGHQKQINKFRVSKSKLKVLVT